MVRENMTMTLPERGCVQLTRRIPVRRVVLLLAFCSLCVSGALPTIIGDGLTIQGTFALLCESSNIGRQAGLSASLKRIRFQLVILGGRVCGDSLPST
ncbi:MAG: hypothetical protein ICV68_12405 [Pyrinomonadaceae bacterium]|nr:hypothetical protein [Pyrinomonadaceae bacterium]